MKKEVEVCSHCGSTDLDESGCWCNNCACWAPGEFIKDLTKEKKPIDKEG